MYPEKNKSFGPDVGTSPWRKMIGRDTRIANLKKARRIREENLAKKKSN